MFAGLSFLLGLIFGSFANVCVYRLPREESIRFPSSHCPHCKKPIPARDNIPLLSFFLLKGRCRFCRKSISKRYPFLELAMGLLFVLSALCFPEDRLRAVTVDLLSFYLLTISVIDYEHKIIPDELSLSLCVLGVLTSFWNPYLQGHTLPGVAESILACLIGGGLMLFLAWGGELLFKKEALGGGDVKLIAGFGAVLGWAGLIGPLVIGSFLGALVGGGLLLLKRKKPGETIPYGPFLCLGAYFSCFFPDWWSPFLFP